MNFADHKPEFQKCLEHYEHELANLRTGRAHPAMLDTVRVDAYGALMDLKSVGTITIPEPRTLQFEPWDKNLLKAVEKGIIAANLGFNPVVDGTAVRVTLPKLNEENRKELTRIMRAKTEEARIACRAVREKARAAILEAEKAKKISEDERYREQENLEKITKQFIEQIESLADKKEKEIMTV
ncbi:ribosome recycling factor [Patescibacteria group bacterium]|nr:MAG: ribosome recycling factor [Patescibacteria group bacterium]